MHDGGGFAMSSMSSLPETVTTTTNRLKLSPAEPRTLSCTMGLEPGIIFLYVCTLFFHTEEKPIV